MEYRIKSVSDVITNSSSEVFVIKNEKKPNLDLKEYITKHCKNNLWNEVYTLDNIPSGLKWIFTDEFIDIVRENCNSTSGTGGDCDVYTWEDGYETYKQLHNQPKLTPEQWAKKLGYSLEELQKIAVVDIDWACRATINMMEQEFTIIDDNGDFLYKNFMHSC